MWVIFIILFVAALFAALKWYGWQRKFYVTQEVAVRKKANMYGAFCILSALTGIVIFIIFLK